MCRGPTCSPRTCRGLSTCDQTSCRCCRLNFPTSTPWTRWLRLNTIRFGLNNRLETKRNTNVQGLLYWDVEDGRWYLRPATRQATFSDVFSTLEFRPRTWLTVGNHSSATTLTRDGSISRRDSIVFQPNSTWNLSLGQFFLRDDPVLGPGSDTINRTFFYRMNENWGARVAEYLRHEKRTRFRSRTTRFTGICGAGRRRSLFARWTTPPADTNTGWQ